MTRRSFATLWPAAAGAIGAPVLLTGTQSSAATASSDSLQSELPFDLLLEPGPRNSVGASRTVVAVSGGTFEGPRLKGTVVGPAGDWITVRPDGSSVLDLRVLLQTDDAQKISMTCLGITYTPPGGTLWARILPLFETGAEKYLWLNTVVAVGVFRPAQGKIAYRVVPDSVALAAAPSTWLWSKSPWTSRFPRRRSRRSPRSNT